MKKISFIFVISLFVSVNIDAQQVTGLDGFSLYLDPGHSRTENMGLYNYSEAEKVLRVGLALRDMLLTQTDIDTVYISRTNDTQQVSLSQRTDRANFLAPDFFHSIHSDAGSSTANHTLFLHGGWRSNGQTVEKSPAGGKDMGNIMEDVHTHAMRIPTVGNWADRNFYQGSSVHSHGNQWAYLHVNRETDMASVLSESGFHTNPRQQQNNLNSEWRRLEAQSFYWVILEYLEVERPSVSIATGFITDNDSDEPINGAVASILDSVYTTDTFESLFNRHSATPDQLKNGFYYIENIPENGTELIVNADGYYPDTTSFVVDTTDFTFIDVSLISSVPPSVVSTTIGDDGSLSPGEKLVLEFSRKMDTESVDSVLTISPPAQFNSSWNSSNTELTITTNNFDFVTGYTISIDSTARDNSIYEHALDGNGDGVAGDSYQVEFTTSQEDIVSPVISDIYPTNTRFNELLPIISATFSEHLDTSLIDENTIQLRLGTEKVPGIIKYYPVGDKSVLNFFPSERLQPNKNYKVQFSASISDTVGNSLGSLVVRTFPTTDTDFVNPISIENFENGLSSWWQPSQSGSTTGYTPDETFVRTENNIVNELTNSSQSMYLSYGFDTTATEHLIREYRSIGLPKFNPSRLLQSYVFGDGSGNQLRFMVRDGNNQLEGSPWYTIDWLGWKLITWDMPQDSVFGWVNGNGVLNGSLHIDSYQIAFTEGAEPTGFLIFDDLRAVETGAPTFTDPEKSDLPNVISLEQNYPNPFNPNTNIQFGIPETGYVGLVVYDLLGREVATLVDGIKTQGYHTINFNASALSSGVYLYRLTIDNKSVVKRMTLIK